MERAAKILVLSLLAVTIGFGFWKQGKIAFRSIEEMRRPAAEAGADARTLRDFFVRRFGASAAALKVGYASDRREAPGRRPFDGAQGRDPAEYVYDVQYGFAPILLHTDGVSDCEVLDFESDGSRDARMQERGLTALNRSGKLTLACRQEGR